MDQVPDVGKPGNNHQTVARTDQQLGGYFFINVKYDQGRVSAARDDSGNLVEYAYDTRNRVETVRYSNGASLQYDYDVSDHMAAVQDIKTGFTLHNKYDSDGRLTEMNLRNRELYNFKYHAAGADRSFNVDITDPDAKTIRVKMRIVDGRTYYTQLQQNSHQSQL